MKYYTGIGSRKTPKQILDLMFVAAKKLSDLNFILRSGGAIGADSAFENGADPNKCEIYTAKDATIETFQIAQKFHPAWERCSNFVQKLHARNVFQILGKDLKTPSNFVICWTPDGATTHEQRSVKTGGTGLAISIACAYKIPVFNLYRDDHLTLLTKFCQK
ncbi:MAG: hypothetical protein PHD05_00295 [Sphaerochaetaceae bacterium]|nr:hypothetical protein [Sphaerochaetaceae bacterium]